MSFGISLADPKKTHQLVWIVGQLMLLSCTLGQFILSKCETDGGRLLTLNEFGPASGQFMLLIAVT